MARLRDADAVLRAIAQRARSLPGTDVACLSLNDPDRGDTCLRVTAGSVAARFRQLRLDMEEGLGGLVARTARPYVTDDSPRDDRFRHTATIDAGVCDEGPVALLGVPLSLARFFSDLDATHVVPAARPDATTSDADQEARARRRLWSAASHLAATRQGLAAARDGGTVLPLPLEPGDTATDRLDALDQTDGGRSEAVGGEQQGEEARGRLLSGAAHALAAPVLARTLDGTRPVLCLVSGDEARPVSALRPAPVTLPVPGT